MKNFFKSLIRCYQLFLSPFLGGQCRFEPTCSVYAMDALEVLPLKKALLKTIHRLLSCHPFHAGGYDPVLPPPEKPRANPKANEDRLSRRSEAVSSRVHRWGVGGERGISPTL